MNPDDASYKTVRETLQLLNEGDQAINKWNHHDDAILVIGITGSGKSTATFFIAGDNTKLEVYETLNDDYLIRDVVEDGGSNKGLISTSENTIVSKTIFPHLTLQPPFETKTTPTAFYDFPGFSDTRSTAIEIANSYFSRKIADNAKRVKVLLVINHNSLKPGMDRRDFILVLQHLSKFFPNMEKYKDSITLLANKAEQKRNNDQKLIEGIVDYLKNMRALLNEVLTDTYLDNGYKLLDGLLQQNDDGKYTRLTFFRKPEKLGLLSDIPEVQKNKEIISDVIHNNTKYVIKEEGDFGFTLSSEAQNEILKITVVINDKIISLFSNISVLLADYFKPTATVSSTTCHLDLHNLHHFPQYFDIIKNLPVVSDNSNEIQAKCFLEKILLPFKSTLPVDIPASILEEIVEQGRYMDIFLEISKNSSHLQQLLSVKPSDWISPLKETFISSQISAIAKASTGIDDMVVSLLNKNQDLITDYIITTFENLIQHPNFPMELRRIVSFLKELKNMEEKPLEPISSLMESYLQLFKKCASRSTDYDSTEDCLITVSKFYELEDQLESKSKGATVPKVKNWQLEMKKGIKWFSNNKTGKKNEGEAIVEEVIKKIQERITLKMKDLCNELRSNFAKNFASRHSEAARFQSVTVEQLRHINSVYDQISISKSKDPPSIFLTSFASKVAAIIHATEFCSLQYLQEEAKGLELLLEVIPERIEIQRSSWFSPVKIFTTDLRCTLQSENYVPIYETIGEETVAKIQGTFVSLKNIVEDENLISQIKKKATHLIILSRHTIYIDTQKSNIHLEGLSLSIISPVWVVADEGRKIVLEGAPAEEFEIAAGRDSEGKGLPGALGNCGGSGGNFLGVGQHIIGGKVHVESIGGKGGNGQNGGSGENGKDGDVVDIRNIKHNCESWHWENFGSALPNITFDAPLYRIEQTNYTDFHSHIRSTLTVGLVRCYETIEYKVTSKRATRGQVGGKGGIAGTGGSHGTIVFHFPQIYCSYFVQQCQNGLTGADGVDGENGKNGKPGADADISVNETKGLWLKTLHNHEELKNPKGSNNFFTQKLEDAKRFFAKSGTNESPPELDQQSPQSSTKVLVKAHDVLKLYHAFARSSCSDPHHRISLLSFLAWLNEFSPNSVSSVEDLIEEFYNLENQYYHEKNQVDFEPFYKMQLEKIHILYNSVESLTNQDEEVILYLRTAALTRYNSFKKDDEPCLIIDMKGYLQQSLKNIKAFQEKAKSKQVLSMIKTTKSIYDDENQNRLKEADSFINDIITPDILNLQTSLDSKMESLLGEIMKLKTDTRHTLEESFLEKRRLELKTQMVMQTLFEAIKIGASMLSSTGTIAAGVRTLVEAQGGVGKILLEHGSKIISGGTVDLSSAVDSLKLVLKDTESQLLCDRVNNFLSRLSVVGKVLKTDDDNHDTNTDNYKKVMNLMAEVRSMAKNTKSSSEVAKLNEKMRSANDVIEVALEDKTSLSFEPTLSVESTKNLLNFGAGLYAKFSGDERKINELSSTICKSQQKLLELNRIEEKVHDEMTLLLEKMKKDLEAALSGMSGRSVVSLDIAKWQIKRMLEDTKLIIKEQFTGGFKVDAEMSRVFDNLSESFTTLIKVFDRMQQIQEQSRLANYIAEINSIPFTEDNKKCPAVQKLDNCIQANVILSQYQLILSSFKMWAFPYARFYLGDLEPVSHSNQSTNHDLKDLITAVEINVDKLLSKVKKQEAIVSSMDHYIHQSRFDDAKSTPGPFYTWTYKANRSLINKFLEGQEVVLNADILGLTSIQKDVIKFNQIAVALDLNFPADDATRKNTLDSELENYNVVLTHMGNSCYRYGSKMYTISSTQTVLSFTFHSFQDGLPSDRNVAYKKVLDGNTMLSPYTMWKIKLKPVKSKRGFQNLVDLIQSNSREGFEPDLKLLGSGTYLSEGSGNDLMLDSYYTPHSF